MKTNLYKEFIEKCAEQFKEHLHPKSNERIIFSGKFGIGKTTFLTEFFNEDNQGKILGDKQKYHVVKIYPVHYAIASNEDVFRYIKHDIILELLKNEKEFKEEVISYWDTAPKFLQKNAHKVLAGIVRMIPDIGKDVVESFKMLDSLKEEFFKYHEDKKREGNELQNLFEYVDEIKKTEGNVYEDDFITKVIQGVLTRKIKAGYKENVLVIDDLDRLDPEHIFRILNIFSAHFDRADPSIAKHKFGFDKVILVCDIKNIREIFSAKYGAKTDFIGYIDKFYSKRIFEYSIKDELASRAFNVINKANWNIYESSNENHSAFEYNLIRQDESRLLLLNIIRMLVENDQLNIRHFKRFETDSLLCCSYAMYHGDYIDMESNATFMRLYQLSVVLGSFSSLKEAIAKCNQPFNVNGYYDIFITNIMTSLFTIPLSKFTSDVHHGLDYTINDKKVSLQRKDNKFKLVDDKSTEIQWSFDDFKLVLSDLVEMISNCRFVNR